MKIYILAVFGLAFIVDLFAAQDPPASVADNCNQNATERAKHHCKAGGSKNKCWDKGCHWCPKKGVKNCIEGLACKRIATDDDDCRDNASHVISPRDCLNRGCSYCKNNNITCVKDLPTPSGNGDLDNCDTTTRKAVSCGAKGNVTLCTELGCHYCEDPDKPNCIEGWACLLTSNDENVCTSFPFEAITPAECLNRNCSWCKDNSPGYQCVKNPSEPVDTGAPPASPVNNCDQTADERIQCPASNNITKCWELGCHYCQKKGAPNCIEGLACKRTPTASDDCRDNDTHVLTPRQCLDRGCSYCEDNDVIKCVKDLPTECSAALSCYPFPDDSITESQCNSTDGCIFCPDAIEADRKCVTEDCPSGLELRYDGNSCCNSSGQPRIVGGVAAQEGQWPWMVSVLIDDGTDQFGCGGFLVDDTHVVSAAHCAKPGATYTLGLGSLEFEGTQTFVLTDVLIHPNYTTFPVLENDIMLFTLPSAVTNFSPLSLPNGEETPDGMTCYVAGWGTTSYGGSGSEVLLEVGLEIQPFAGCDTTYSTLLTEEYHLCAGIPAGGKDSCQGDSGGALMCQRCLNCDWYAAGIVSFGDNCALPNTPGVYTRVTTYEEWLHVEEVDDEGVEYDCNLY